MYIYYAKDKVLKKDLFTSKKDMETLSKILSEMSFLKEEKIVLERFSRKAAKSVLNASMPLVNIVPILNKHCTNIHVYGPWVAHLILFPDEQDTLNAFRSTLGHELTHLEMNDIPVRVAKSRKASDRRFIRWVNEVHCDFNGMSIAFANDYDKSISAMKYLLHHKKLATGLCVEKMSKTHPSRELRLKYITIKRFDSELVAEIAKDAGCTNDALIEIVAKHFSPITLQ